MVDDADDVPFCNLELNVCIKEDCDIGAIGTTEEIDDALLS